MTDPLMSDAELVRRLGLHPELRNQIESLVLGNRLDPRSTGLTAIKDAQVSEAAFFACVLFRSPLHCGACKMF